MKKNNTFLNLIYKVLGPIFLSASSLFISFQIVQPIAYRLDSSLDLLASRGFGKIAFSIMAILQVFLFLSMQSKNFIESFLNTSVYYFWDKNFLKTILKYFFTFFILHWLVLVGLLALGQIAYNPNYVLSLSLIPNLAWGVLVTFFLAWSEELIFRGMFYPYFAQSWSPLTSLLSASLCFMLVHDLTNPINLVTINYKIGLGLFLLGLLLNTIYVISGKLYTGMGVHMGLVSVKVVLRRIPFLTFLDLRQSHLVHVLFALTIIILILSNKDKIFLSNRAQQPQPANQ